MNKRIRTSLIAISITLGLTFLKFLFYYLSGSIAVLSEAWHSFSDITTSLLVLFALWRSTSIAKREQDQPTEENKDDSVDDLIWIHYKASNVTVEDCYISNVGRESNQGVRWSAGIWIGGDDCIVRNCSFKDTWGTGVTVEAVGVGYNVTGNASRNLIEGCTGTGYVSHFVHCENFYSDNTTVRNNHVYDINSTCYIDGPRGISISVDSVCVDNQMVRALASKAGINKLISVAAGDNAIDLTSDYQLAVFTGLAESTARDDLDR